MYYNPRPGCKCIILYKYDRFLSYNTFPKYLNLLTRNTRVFYSYNSLTRHYRHEIYILQIYRLIRVNISQIGKFLCQNHTDDYHCWNIHFQSSHLWVGPFYIWISVCRQTDGFDKKVPLRLCCYVLLSVSSDLLIPSLENKKFYFVMTITWKRNCILLNICNRKWSLAGYLYNRSKKKYNFNLGFQSVRRRDQTSPVEYPFGRLSVCLPHGNSWWARYGWPPAAKLGCARYPWDGMRRRSIAPRLSSWMHPPRRSLQKEGTDVLQKVTASSASPSPPSS